MTALSMFWFYFTPSVKQFYSSFIIHLIHFFFTIETFIPYFCNEMKYNFITKNQSIRLTIEKLGQPEFY